MQRRHGARARTGRHAASSRIEVRVNEALHRARPTQRHAVALLNDARSYRPQLSAASTNRPWTARKPTAPRPQSVVVRKAPETPPCRIGSPIASALVPPSAGSAPAGRTWWDPTGVILRRRPAAGYADVLGGTFCLGIVSLAERWNRRSGASSGAGWGGAAERRWVVRRSHTSVLGNCRPGRRPAPVGAPPHSVKGRVG